MEKSIFLRMEKQENRLTLIILLGNLQDMSCNIIIWKNIKQK